MTEHHVNAYTWASELALVASASTSAWVTGLVGPDSNGQVVVAMITSNRGASNRCIEYRVPPDAVPPAIDTQFAMVMAHGW